MSLNNTILVVDDEKIICKNCEKILSAEGYTVFSVQSGIDCLNMLHKQFFNLIILDLKLPDTDGLELLEKVKKFSPQTVIVIITGFPTLESSIKAMRLGTLDYITKPFTPDELLTSVDDALSKQCSTFQHRSGVRGNGHSAKIRRLQDSDFTNWMPSAEEPAYYSDFMAVRLGKDNTARIILHPLFFIKMGLVTSIDLPAVGQVIDKSSPCVVVHYNSSSKPVDRNAYLIPPVSGTVKEINTSAVMDINRITDDPFHSYWLFRVIPGDYADEIATYYTRKICIADDNTEVRSELSNYFREYGYSVYNPQNSQEIWEGITGQNFDLLILGEHIFNNPLNTILETIEKAKEKIPVIVINSNRSDSLFAKVRPYNIYYFGFNPHDKIQIGLAVKNSFSKLELERSKDAKLCNTNALHF